MADEMLLSRTEELVDEVRQITHAVANTVIEEECKRNKVKCNQKMARLKTNGWNESDSGNWDHPELTQMLPVRGP